MLNFTKTVGCLVIGTAEQIDTRPMHPFEKFRQNLLVKFYSMKDFSFLTHKVKQRKTGVGCGGKHIKTSHMLLKQSSENVFVVRKKDCWAQVHDMAIFDEPFGTS